MNRKLRTLKRPNYELPENTSDSLIADLQLYLKTCSGPKAKYLVQHMLSKYADPQPALILERRKAAIDKWLRTEQRNERTNTRLYDLVRDRKVWFDNGATNQDVLACARRLVKSVIGNHVPYHLLGGSFSGGASTSKRRQPGMVGRKFSGVQDVSEAAWPYMLPVILGSLWRNEPGAVSPNFVNHSVLFTVPKNDTIDRVACKEPDYNMYLQKGVGDFIRHRLRKRCQIDLNDQSVNQRLAKIGSTDGSLATIDLSSASDSVTISLVSLILPEEWYNYLDAIRVKMTLVDDALHALRMFSSMGNGFTFELESLIFWALCSATIEVGRQGTRRDVKVYGDDIIVPTKCYPVVKRTLNYCGFLVNDEKSFYRGPIRESCGKHYYFGRDITPFYIRGPLKNQMDLINVLNSLRRWSAVGDGLWADYSTFWIWEKYSRLVGRQFHGGHDLNDSSRLVTPERIGAFRLCRARKYVTGCESGEYLAWLHDAERREKLSLNAHESVVESSRLVSRRVDAYPFPRYVTSWPQEIELT